MKWRRGKRRGKRSGFGRTRLAAALRTLLLVVLAAVTVVIWVYAFTGRSPLSIPGKGPLTASGSATLSPFVSVTPTSGSPTSGSPASVTPTSGSDDLVTSLWFGDSIVQGCCRTAPSSLNMAQVASKSLGWQVPQVQGFPGTGYTTKATVKGVTRPAYADNIAQYVDDAHYRVVIVAGGNNDARKGFSPEDFRAAVRATLQHVRHALPDAKLVVVGPYSPDGTGYTDQRTIEREEAARAGALFIDGIAPGWFKGQSALLAKDGFSPNDAGQAYLGIRVAAELKKLQLS
jgi:lysophospholipase L1-like esterase